MQSDTVPAPAAGLLSVDVRRFPWIRVLAADYAFRFDKLAPFYSGDPASKDAWSAAIARAHAYRRQPDTLAAIIAEQQQARGASTAARRAAAQLADPRTVVIITGQQAGLFGGPLFTLLKALTTMKLAARISREQGVTVVPVFWIDAEDHDWREVNGCVVLDEEFQPHTVRTDDPPGAGNVPIARLALTDSVDAALAELESVLDDTGFRQQLLAELRAAYRPGYSVTHAFGCWMETVLGTHGLVIYDSSDQAAKALAQPVFIRELAHAGRTAALATEKGRELVARGYHAQVEPAAGALALFHLNGGRESMRANGTMVTIAGTEQPLPDLATEAERAPEHFSPSVLLRPVVQDTLFPTICYVAGPSELAYWGQLRPVYDHFGVPMPLVYQRATATVVDSATLRFLTRYQVPLESLQPQDESALNALLEAQLPPTVEQALSATEAALNDRMAAVAGAVRQIDPTLEATVRTTLGRMEHDLHTLHNKVINAAKRRDDTLRRQFQRAQALTFPHGEPQERALSFVYFLNRYGPAFVDRLLEELPLEMGQHSVLAI